MNRNYIGFVIVIIACQAWTIHSQCNQVTGNKGIVLDTYRVSGNAIIERCWKIPVPAGRFINATIELPSFNTREKRNCNYAYVEVKMQNVGSKKLCGFDDIGNEVVFLGDKSSSFEIIFYINSAKQASNVEYSFRLKYFIEINGIDEVREKSINWLKERHHTFYGWKEDTPRAVTALYLAGGAQFNGSLIEEIMAKQAELRTALALTWKSVTIERLSYFINALLATCMKPQRFFGHDLVDKLLKKVESSGNFTHPAAYLALCNANETWPNRSASDLSYVLSSNSDYRFVRDLQALAVLAISCDDKRRDTSVTTEDNNLRSLYSETIKRMKGYKQRDGSFGNPHTTALFTQALIASDQKLAKDWRVNDNIQYLMNELNTSDVNILTVCASLPLLNGKTLADIAHVKCKNNPRFEGEDPLLELKDNRGPKIRVQYSLYIGDKKDVVHTISLRVPRNSTAYKILELSALQDKKYEFKVETIGNVKHIYEIAGIPNDPEDGKMWLLYVKKRDRDILPYTSNPEDLILDDGEQLIMWYQTQEI